MPFEVYIGAVDTEHEPRDAEHEHEIDRKLPHGFFAATLRGNSEYGLLTTGFQACFTYF